MSQDKDTSVIPQGIYCNTANARCPYWSRNAEIEDKQNDGHCAYLDQGDWEDAEFGGLLWDGVKDCGINTEE